MPDNIRAIKTLGQLKKAGYESRSIKDEIRENLISKLKNKENPFPGIFGYEDSVIPDTERALLSRHNILYLGLRGQAKTRMARQMVSLMDEYIPVIKGSEVNDDPLKPVSAFATELIKQMGDETPIEWLHRSARYGEKLATPDVSVADLIGDIDPIKAANMKLSFADERVLHYGIIPRSNRGIFVINELPDLQARIQVSLFNILEEGDLQIRGFKLRLPLDVMFIFTANPEDYTNRGSIVTPLKDRIESQILTHYPKSLDTALTIAGQEARIMEQQHKKVRISDIIKRLIAQVSFEARESELVDRKSGVSARLTISAMENAVSSAERRAIINGETQTQVWISDLAGILPSITGKIELVYEGEQEGPFQVAFNLLERSIRTQFKNLFPDPDSLKKRKNEKDENPYRNIIQWFDSGNMVELNVDISDKERAETLKQVPGLADVITRYFPKSNNDEQILLMEFLLHGLAANSLISKKMTEGTVSFRDLVGSMFSFQQQEEEENENDDF